MQLVLVMPATHKLASRKQVRPECLRDLALAGLAPESFPDYVPHIKKLLKPLGIKPRFAVLERDGVATMLATLEAYNAAAILADTSVGLLPRSLVWRPFVPRFDPVIARIGWCAVNSKPHARSFVSLLLKAAQHEKTTRRSSGC